jgi:hypothetical protein
MLAGPPPPRAPCEHDEARGEGDKPSRRLRRGTRAWRRAERKHAAYVLAVFKPWGTDVKTEEEPKKTPWASTVVASDLTDRALVDWLDALRREAGYPRFDEEEPAASVEGSQQGAADEDDETASARRELARARLFALRNVFTAIEEVHPRGLADVGEGRRGRWGVTVSDASAHGTRVVDALLVVVVGVPRHLVTKSVGVSPPKTPQNKFTLPA